MKEAYSGKLFFCCTECETEGINPEHVENEIGTQYYFHGIERFNIEEIVDIGWDKYFTKKLGEKTNVENTRYTK
ncbi:hypothetical protein HCB38_05075 [Listeria sp. FSL L7-0083]|uniref:hypothetical protein n=1 Tax=Listeria farberi TaxID=2713500 RepID=UPI00162A8A08|nr:hypothetical protein [Listeria farberi]MBC2267193.1 hypothetical protein [Listeria farberi]